LRAELRRIARRAPAEDRILEAVDWLLAAQLQQEAGDLQHGCEESGDRRRRQHVVNCVDEEAATAEKVRGRAVGAADAEDADAEAEVGDAEEEDGDGARQEAGRRRERAAVLAAPRRRRDQIEAPRLGRRRCVTRCLAARVRQDAEAGEDDHRRRDEEADHRIRRGEWHLTEGCDELCNLEDGWKHGRRGAEHDSQQECHRARRVVRAEAEREDDQVARKEEGEADNVGAQRRRRERAVPGKAGLEGEADGQAGGEAGGESCGAHDLVGGPCSGVNGVL
jgi:hypothetical protein